MMPENQKGRTTSAKLHSSLHTWDMAIAARLTSQGRLRRFAIMARVRI
jgi:hypothetical protein